MNPSESRSAFPATSERAYFNHAAIAPLPLRAAQAMRAQIDDAMRHGVHGYSRWVRQQDGLRRATSEMLNCDPIEIAVTKNTSEGLLAIANGLDFKPGDAVVGLAEDFPANVVPWRELCGRHGVEFRSLELRQGLLDLEDLDRACKGARLAALSYVHFLTGFRWDLRAAGEICRRRGCALVLDAVQGMGAFPIDVKSHGVHALAASGHKWLLGPEGCGVLYVDRDWLPEIKPVELGWGGYEDFEEYRIDGPLHPGARRFECGTLNSVGCAGLRASVEMLNEVGAGPASSAINRLAEQLLAGALEKGYEAAAPRSRATGSGIVSLRRRDLDSAQVVATLFANSVSVAERMGWIRAAPHFYNTADEIDRLVDLLP